jgi:hypothetical protein
MKPRVRTKQKIILFALIGLGFAGLIGAHEVAAMAPSPGGTPNTIAPLILAALGTLCFIAAGLMARKLMR